jgi:hypothetical protein
MHSTMNVKFNETVLQAVIKLGKNSNSLKHKISILY